MTLTAAQLVFGNVEREQSPNRTGGFQTIFYTHERLTQAEIEQIEPRLFYLPGDQNPIKRVFFWLPTGKYVLGQITPVLERDRFGRTGRYLAHCLVFEAAEFDAAGAPVAAVFRQATFLSDLATALSAGDLTTGHIPPIAIHLTESDMSPVSEAIAGWAQTELKKLWLLALQADRLTAALLAVEIIGTQTEIESTIDVALACVPPQLVKHCSFDTWFRGGNPVATLYWAVAGGIPAARRAATVDAAHHTVSIDSPLAPRNAFERWVCTMIDRDQAHTVLKHKLEAFNLCSWLESQHTPALSPPPPAPVVESLLESNREALQSKLVSTLKASVPEPLATRAAAHLIQTRTPTDLISMLCGGIQPEAVADVLLAAIAEAGLKAHDRTEITALGEFLAKHKHPALGVIHACWARATSRLRQILAELDPHLYEHMVGLMLQHRLGTPEQLAVPGRGEQLVRAWLAARDSNLTGLDQLVSALASTREVQALNALAPMIRDLPPHLLARVASALAGISEPPIELVRELAARGVRVPARGGLLSRLKHKLLG